MKVITLSGNKRSGKDTSLGYIKEMYPNTIGIAFADKLKSNIVQAFQNVDLVNIKDNLTIDDLYDRGRDRERPLTFMNKCIMYLATVEFIKLFPNLSDFEKLLISDKALKLINAHNGEYSIRFIMQFLGTDVGVNLYNKNVWVDYVREFITDDDKHDIIVITDARQEHEFQFAQDLNSFNIHLINPKVKASDSHITEQDIGLKYADVVITNDKTLDDLKSSIEQTLIDWE